LVEDTSKEILSTHQSLSVPNRLIYGIASATGIYQKEIKNIVRKWKM